MTDCAAIAVFRADEMDIAFGSWQPSQPVFDIGQGASGSSVAAGFSRVGPIHEGLREARADNFFAISFVAAVAQIACAAGRIEPSPHALRADFSQDVSRAFFHFAIWPSRRDR